MTLLTGIISFFASLAASFFVPRPRLAKDDRRTPSIPFDPAVLLDSSRDIIAVLDSEGVIRFISGAVIPYLDRQPEQLLGQPLTDYVHPEDVLRTNVELNRLTQGDDAIDAIVLRLQNRQGAWLPFEINAVDRRADPAVNGILLTAQHAPSRSDESDTQVAVVAVAAAMRRAPNPQAIAEVFLSQLDELLNASGAALAVPERGNGYRLKAANGLWAPAQQQLLPGGHEWLATLFHEGTPQIVDMPRQSSLGLPAPLAALVAVPLIAQEQVVGVVLAGRDEPWTLDALRLLAEIGDMAANALRRAARHEETRRRADQLTIINRLGRRLAETPSLKQIYAATAETVQLLMPDIVAFLISSYDDKAQAITAVYAIHEGETVDIASLPTVELEPPGSGVQSQVIRNRQPLIVDNLGVDLSDRRSREQGILAGLYAPMVTGERVLGVIQVQSFRTEPFTNVDLELLSLVANTAGIAVQNAALVINLKRSNGNLKQVAGELRQLIDHANAPIFGVDGEGLINEWNRSAAQITGYSRREVLGRDMVAEFIPPPQQRTVRRLIQEALQGQSTVNYELTVRTRHSSDVVILFNATPRLDLEGRVIGMVGVGQDITERKRAEEALRQSEQTNRALLDTFPDLLFRVARDGTILDVRVGEQGLPVPRHAAIGMLLQDTLDAVPPDIRSVIREIGRAFQEALDDGEARTIAHRLDKGNEHVHYESRIIPRLPDEALVIVRDISEQRHAEESLRQTQRLESIGLLAGGIAHDFNNLLTAMLGQASLALEKLPPADPVRHHIEKAVTSTEKAADLTRQLLAYAGKGQFQVLPLNLNQLIRENAALLQTVLPTHVRLLLDLAPGLPQMMADPGQIQQVVMNLVMNAAESIQSGDGVVKLCTIHVDRPTLDIQNVVGEAPEPLGESIGLEVSDNGRGMPSDILERIFDPFFTTKEQGRGLGLSATLGIIRTHGGSLQVQSQHNEGSRFQIYFPVTEIEPGIPAPRGLPTTTAPLSGKILVIDDEAPIRDAVRDILDRLDLDVLDAADGREGIAIFEAHRDAIRVVLLDMQMPVMNGLETFTALRAIDPHVKVILSSGYSETEATRRFVGKGLAGFLQKPYSIAELRKRVQLVIQGEVA